MSPSSPKPFDKMPIVYERAFGGMTADAAEMRNLVGVGFRGASPRNPDIQTEVPNIEYHNRRMLSKSDTPDPAGLNVIGRGWMPRIRYAGTFDKQWQERRWPLLPADFDSRYNQCAPIDQQSRSLRGGEAARLVNLTGDGEWQFRLPVLNIPMLSLYADGQTESTLRLDTVLIEPDVKRVTMTSRLAFTPKRNRRLLREIIVGHVARGWVRARVKGKKYLDSGARNGAPASELHYLL
jgi:hypothetical protein